MSQEQTSLTATEALNMSMSADISQEATNLNATENLNMTLVTSMSQEATHLTATESLDMAWATSMSQEATHRTATEAFSKPDSLSCPDLSDVNRKYMHSTVMVLIFMVILMVSGIAGNLIVVLVYILKRQKATANYFMQSLAASDLFTSSVVHPYMIFKLVHYYDPDVVQCKVFEFFVHSSVGIQLFLLLSVALDRYYAVCKPLRFVHAHNRAVALILLSFSVGYLYCTPVFVFFGQRTIDVLVEGNCVISLTYCDYNDRWDGTFGHTLFGGSTTLIMVTVVIVIGVLYSKVARAVYTRNRRVAPTVQVSTLNGGMVADVDPSDERNLYENNHRILRKQNSNITGKMDGRSINESSISYLSTHQSTSSSTNQNKPCRKSTAQGQTQSQDQLHLGENNCSSASTSRKTVTFDYEGICPEPTRSRPTLRNSRVVPVTSSLRKHRVASESSVKAAKLLFLVTAIFFLSWLPFWVLKIWSIAQPDTFEMQVSTAVRSVCNHIFFLNNAVNPIIYVFVNSNFRADCKALITRKRSAWK